jgi:exopolyphosphatase / guanosine-5'-triphosphate,3'-diphosphate pyrophosphatase
MNPNPPAPEPAKPNAALATVAAVDLGSNSFHLVVARLDGGGLHVLDRLRDRVRLAAGLDAEHMLTAESMERAIACLTRFGQRLRELPQGAVRAAGTNTLRQAKNGAVFLERARHALGHPIEIIAGREEARLIYLGVSQSVPDTDGRRLVIDIGGGSTECTLGEGFEPVATESLFMGCVSFSQRYFPNGAIGREDFRRAELAAMLELRSIERRYRGLGWNTCYGSSGTALAIAEIIRAGDATQDSITRKALKKLRAALCDAGHVTKVDVPGLDPDRAAVLPGGLAILMAAFKSLEIEAMRPASGALREGLLYDLVGRIRHEDVRERTIRGLAERARVDLEHAARVERTARYCLNQISNAWELDRDEASLYLSWAARLHEIGLEISHTGYQRHGAYVLENADMPGFSKHEQALLSVLVLAHRRKIRPEQFARLPEERRAFALRSSVVFRIACCLNRSRSSDPLPEFGIEAKKSAITLRFPSRWLDGNPLTRADLEEEKQRLDEVGVKLEVSLERETSSEIEG